MHELSVCKGIIKQVNQVAKQHNNYLIDKIHIQVGPLSGVVADLLEAVFPLASAETPASNAALLIELMPIRVRCIRCGSETDTSPNQLLCGSCGNWRTQLISGDELILRRVELRPAKH